MSRTKRSNKGKFSEVLRSANRYKRQKRQDILKEFEREYLSSNNTPLIEL